MKPSIVVPSGWCVERQAFVIYGRAKAIGTTSLRGLHEIFLVRLHGTTEDVERTAWGKYIAYRVSSSELNAVLVFVQSIHAEFPRPEMKNTREQRLVLVRHGHGKGWWE